MLSRPSAATPVFTHGSIALLKTSVSIIFVNRKRCFTLIPSTLSMNTALQPSTPLRVIYFNGRNSKSTFTQPSQHSPHSANKCFFYTTSKNSLSKPLPYNSTSRKAPSNHTFATHASNSKNILHLTRKITTLPELHELLQKKHENETKKSGGLSGSDVIQ